MGMRMPETCWAVFKRQVINLRSCCIWFVDSVESMMMHGLAKYDDARTCKVWWCTDLQSMMMHGFANLKYIKTTCFVTSLAVWTNYWNYFCYTTVYCRPAYDTPDVREQKPAWQQLIISRKIVMDVKCSTDVLATWRGSRGWYQSITEWRGLVTSLHHKL